MIKFSFRKKKEIAVVEIGNDWLKILVNTPQGRSGVVSRGYFRRLNEINEPMPQALAKVLKGLRLENATVITYLPRHLVTVRALEFPSVDREEIENMVSLQVGKQTPYSKEEIVSSHKIVDSQREGYTRVILVIARRNIVSERIEALQKAGAAVEKVIFSSEAVYNWFGLSSPQEEREGKLTGNIILDIDFNFTDFIVIRRQRLVFTRHISTGVNQLLGSEPEWPQKFAEEVVHSIERYRNEAKDASLARIFLCGAVGGLDGVSSLIEEKAGIPCGLIAPFRNIRKAPLLRGVNEQDLKLVSVCALIGAALRPQELEIELTPAEFKIKKTMEAARKDLTRTGVLLVALAMTVSLLFLINIYNKTAHLDMLKDKISLVEKEAGEVDKARKVVELVEESLDASGSSLNMLNEIHNLVPNDIHFSKIYIEDKKQATLRGYAAAMSDVFEFVTTLENSHYFENVKSTYATMKKSKDGEYAEFEILCAYQRRLR